MRYVGNPLQIRGAEKVMMEDGKAYGMHFLIIRNGLGLEVWISLDRCADLFRVIYNGKNMGYMSPSGNVSPGYYDDKGAGWLKSFCGGFLATAGLNAVGSPCNDEGEELPLHGTIGNTPSVLNSVLEDEEGIRVIATIRDCSLFSRHLILTRKYFISYKENTITLKDEVKNENDGPMPFEILYHCNLGYPLVSENAQLMIPNNGIKPRNDHARENLPNALVLEKPQPFYEESCFYYDVLEKEHIAKAGIYNDKIKTGVVFVYDKRELPYFTEWKMMGNTEYVLGLEPGNCTPDGRDVMRKNGTLQFIEPEKTKVQGVTWKFIEQLEEFKGEFAC